MKTTGLHAEENKTSVVIKVKISSYTEQLLESIFTVSIKNVVRFYNGTKFLQFSLKTGKLLGEVSFYKKFHSFFTQQLPPIMESKSSPPAASMVLGHST